MGIVGLSLPYRGWVGPPLAFCPLLNYSFLSLDDFQHTVKQREMLDNNVVQAVSLTGIPEVEYNSQEVGYDTPLWHYCMQQHPIPKLHFTSTPTTTTT